MTNFSFDIEHENGHKQTVTIAATTKAAAYLQLEEKYGGNIIIHRCYTI